MTDRRVDARRSWPPMLRHALRTRLAAEGRRIPKGLRILHRRDDERGDAVEVRHDPGPTERMTISETVTTPFVDGRASETFLETASLHALRMDRTHARLEMLVADGHDPRRPPRSMLEAHPLVAWAETLRLAGRIGCSADLQIVDGIMTAQGIDLAIGGIRLSIEAAGRTRVGMAGSWPVTLEGLEDMPLSGVIRLPACGRDEVDAAVRDLMIEATSVRSGILRMTLQPSDVVPLDDGARHAWMDMTPRPTA